MCHKSVAGSWRFFLITLSCSESVYKQPLPEWRNMYSDWRWQLQLSMCLGILWKQLWKRYMRSNSKCPKTSLISRVTFNWYYHYYTFYHLSRYWELNVRLLHGYMGYHVDYGTVFTGCGQITGFQSMGRDLNRQPKFLPKEKTDFPYKIKLSTSVKSLFFHVLLYLC